jgi:hypothetical protein
MKKIINKFRDSSAKTLPPNLQHRDAECIGQIWNDFTIKGFRFESQTDLKSWVSLNKNDKGGIDLFYEDV